MPKPPKKTDKPTPPQVVIDPFTREEFVVGDYSETELKARQEADVKAQQLLEAGYIRQSKAADRIGIKINVLKKRARDIDPDSDYLPNGDKPTGAEGEETVKGSELKWIHPYNTNIVLLHPEYVACMEDVEKKARELKQKGYVIQFDAASIIGITNSNMVLRNKKIIPDDEYLTCGLPPTGDEGEKTIKGEELVWVNPYSQVMVLLHPDYVEGMRIKMEEEKKLIERGYVRQTDAARIIGISASNMVSRNKKIIPDDEYLTCGLPPTGAEGERTVKGSELRWSNPYGNLVLLHSEYVAGMADAEKKTRELQTRNYIRPPDAAKIVGIEQDSISERSRAIDPNEDYLPNGLPPTGAKGEKTIKGSELRWQNPYSHKMVMLHPDYVAGMKIAEEEEKELIERGYIRQADAAIMVGVEQGTMSARSVKIDSDKDYLPNGLPPTGAEGEKTIKGSELKWVHPYNQVMILLHPDYVEGMKAAEKKARELQEKGYLSQADASRKTDISQIAISERSSKIKPDKYYLPSGASPDEIAGKEQIKGSELRWHHPYSNQFLLHPDFVAALEAEYAGKSTVRRGAKSEIVGAAEIGDTEIAEQLAGKSKKGMEK